MKCLGLCGITITILLICNPVAHCFWQLNQILNELRIHDAKFVQRIGANDALINNLNTQINSARSQLTKTEETLSVMKQSIESLSSTVTKNVEAFSASINRLNRRLDDTDQKLNSIQKEREINFSQESMRTMCMGFAVENNTFERQITETDKLLKKYDHKLNTYNDTVDGVTNNLFELNERLVRTAEACHNKTSEDLTKLTKSDQAYNDIMKNFSTLFKEVQELSKKQSTILQTASKIDTVHESKFLEIKDLVKAQTQHLNNKLNNSINEDQVSVDANQMSALLALAHKIESEMEYVSCDIIDIYNELIVNKTSCDEEPVQELSTILQTASKIDTVHESKFLEIKDLVKAQTQHLNNKPNNSINEDQVSVDANQMSALLAHKIESKMKYVSCIDIYNKLIVNKTSRDEEPEAIVSLVLLILVCPW